MTRFSHRLLALSLLLPGCMLSQHDQPSVVDGGMEDDAGDRDGSLAVNPVEQPSAADTLRSPGTRAQEAASVFAGVVHAPAEPMQQEPASPAQATQADPTLEPGRPSEAARLQLSAEHPATEAAATAEHWEREVLPTSLAGVATTPYDDTVLQRDACRGVMSEGELCTCLSGPIDPEHADSYGSTCSHRALGVPGFGVFTDRAYTTYVTAQKDGGFYKLAYVDSAGFSSFGVSGGRLMRAGKLEVLAIDMSQASGCTNDSWELEVVQLCALRELDSPHFGRCVSVPVRSLFGTWIPETDKTEETLTRVGFQLTSRGTVKVRAKGKIRHREVRKALGEHTL
jgi:hypothetical protein